MPAQRAARSLLPAARLADSAAACVAKRTTVGCDPAPGCLGFGLEHAVGVFRGNFEDGGAARAILADQPVERDEMRPGVLARRVAWRRKGFRCGHLRCRRAHRGRQGEGRRREDKFEVQRFQNDEIFQGFSSLAAPGGRFSEVTGCPSCRLGVTAAVTEGDTRRNRLFLLRGGM